MIKSMSCLLKNHSKQNQFAYFLHKLHCHIISCNIKNILLISKKPMMFPCNQLIRLIDFAHRSILPLLV